jgi:diaminopimelate decarboxylase
MLRVTVGVEAHTHEFIATGHEDQKFGFSLAGGVAFERGARAF